jgi:hypothetical protein
MYCTVCFGKIFVVRLRSTGIILVRRRLSFLRGKEIGAIVQDETRQQK